MVDEDVKPSRSKVPLSEQRDALYDLSHGHKLCHPPLSVRQAPAVQQIAPLEKAWIHLDCVDMDAIRAAHKVIAALCNMPQQNVRLFFQSGGVRCT
jgi:hypothetical protein